ncbi:hypothetical protein [Urechidicola croceus]|uniref:Uncharacterized protein n=1 Tax=Urechidicola croceus TaxID=1850246 RepID=A0A1D8P6F1_9FLAO|nr:hypothetical protein [Urechidicola croceus]AOW20146.1 hypothetical protein LPB138_05380 [Urechidicola croceus]
MNIHADKSQENKDQYVANTVSQKQIISNSTFQFIDNRPEMVIQRKLQDMVYNSSNNKHVNQLYISIKNKKKTVLKDLQEKPIQPKLWDNLEQVFETKNTLNNNGNSKYTVKSPLGLIRYAPINKEREPNQVHNDKPNAQVCFFDKTSQTEFSKQRKNSEVTAVTNGDEVTLTTKNRQTDENNVFIASLNHQSGKFATDFDYNDDKKMITRFHPGHMPITPFTQSLGGVADLMKGEEKIKEKVKAEEIRLERLEQLKNKK